MSNQAPVGDGLRLVLFDCDGTLVDSAATIVATMRAAFARVGRTPPSEDAVRAIIGLSMPQAIATLAPDADPHAVRAAYRDVYFARTDTAPEPLFAGVTAMLEAVDGANTLLGVVTGKSRRGLDAALAAHGIAARFVVTVTADDAASKPAPEMVSRALTATGAEPARTLVVGDAVHDIAMARAAGVRSLGVTWGNASADALTAAGADALAKTVEALPDLIDALLPTDAGGSRAAARTAP